MKATNKPFLGVFFCSMCILSYLQRKHFKRAKIGQRINFKYLSIMTQSEYDEKMHELNTRADMETAPMRAEMDSILRRRQVITAQMDELKKQRHELGNRYFDLCAEVKAVKDKYNEQKYALYIERPSINTNNE